MTDGVQHSSQATTNQQPVVVFDGDCAFCRKQVARLQRRDRDGVFEYLPKQTPGLEERFPQLANMDFEKGLRFVGRDGRIAVGADGVYEIARRLSVYRWFAWLYRVPLLHSLFRGIYAWIARNRYKLVKNCDDGACDISAAPATDAKVESR